MKNIVMIPLILNIFDLPIAYWCPELTAIILLHGRHQQLVTKIMFDGMMEKSCPLAVDLPVRKPIRESDEKIYNRHGKIVATYNKKDQKLTVWHDRITTVIALPEHKGMHWEN